VAIIVEITSGPYLSYSRSTHTTMRDMDFKRTYFQNRIAEEELWQLLGQRTSFFLENVANVEMTTAGCADRLRTQGLICQIRDNRRRPYAEAKEMAAISFPLIFGVFFFVKELWRSVKQRLDNPNPHVIIIQTLHALDVRFRQRA